MMNIHCPACEKENNLESQDLKNEASALQCDRCSCDLELLVQIRQAATYQLSLSRKKLREGYPLASLSHAQTSWQLQQSVEVAQTAFLACIVNGDYNDALAIWYSRCMGG